MRIIGLTGSIGMGKSTTASMFRARGIPVHDADAAVHRLYAGEAVAAVESLFPGVAAGGVVDRGRLAAYVSDNPKKLAALERIVHPLVRHSEAAFVARSRLQGARTVVLDVPLLFETGGSERVDTVVVVSAGADIQRSRVLARAGMNPAKFQVLLARQLPDREKRRRAHFLVMTDRGKPAAARQVDAILRAVALTT